jgi:hypothetical protein
LHALLVRQLIERPEHDRQPPFAKFAKRKK